MFNVPNRQIKVISSKFFLVLIFILFLCSYPCIKAHSETDNQTQPNILQAQEVKDVENSPANGKEGLLIPRNSIEQDPKKVVKQAHSTIKASTNGFGGEITPAGKTVVTENNSQVYTINPDPGYEIADVIIDGNSIGAVDNYSFNDTSTDHIIAVSFKRKRIAQQKNLTFYSNEPSDYDTKKVSSSKGKKEIKSSNNNNQDSRTVSNYKITVTANLGGSISPSGDIVVPNSASQEFFITPDANYMITDVLIDGFSVGSINNYIFTNIKANHSISVVFKPIVSVVIRHSITVLSGPNGAMVPAGVITVNEGDNQTILIDPDSNYHVTNVLVDGVSVGALSSYTFFNVVSDHTISASFGVNVPNTHTITVSSSTNGSIEPSGAVTINEGASQTFTITPALNYHVVDVLVDGVSVGAVSNYTFNNVTSDHVISVSYALNLFTVTASADAHGMINPAGLMTVNAGSDQLFTVTADHGYNVKDIYVDGVSVGAANTYTLTRISSNQNITASFVATHSITASAGPNGSISPSGITIVNDGASLNYTITPNSGYKIQTLLVDQIPVEVGTTNNTYTFLDVTGNHEIRVNFVEIGRPVHNFTFDFDLNTTLLKRLNWISSEGVVKTLVWDEQTRFPWNTQYYSPSWVKHYFHSLTGSNIWQLKTGPKYRLANDPQQTIELYQGNLTYTLLSQNSNIVQLKAVSNNLNLGGTLAGPNDLKLEDTFKFVEDTVYLTLKISNMSNQKMISLEVPVYFGSLMIGNFDSRRKIKVCQLNAAGMCDNPEDGPKLGRLRSTIGGVIEPLFENPANSSYDMYPDSGIYSPVAVLWGAAKFGFGEDIIGGDSSMTIGAQFLTNVSLPTSVGFVEIPANQHSPEIGAKIITSLEADESKTFTIAFKVVDGLGGINLAGKEVWQAALKPYQDWFNVEYGTLNQETQKFEPIPQYCPTEPFTYFVGSNIGPPTYDRNLRRYAPNTTLRNVFFTDTKRDLLHRLGIKRFGVWQTAINGNLIDGNEFNPNIALIDPNLDAGRDPLKINDFTNAYAQNNVDVLWFARPCRYIEGANVNYNTVPATIIPGTWNGYVDLNVPANRDRYFHDMKSLVDRGVKGFYLDEGDMCPGYENFVKYVKTQFKNQNNLDIFLAQEGAVDRTALLAPEIPVLKLPNYNWNSSVLLSYLVPDATYYQGEIDSPLTDEETNDVLNKGYQIVRGLPHDVTSYLCKTIKMSHDNQVTRWQRYGQKSGCPMPAEVSDACLNYPDIYYLPTVTVGAGGSVSPTVFMSPGVLEGSHVTFTISANSGYHIKNITVTNDGVGNHMVTPGNVTNYVWISPVIVGNANIDVTFERTQ